MTLSWADNPRTSGKAVGSIKIADKIWRTSGKTGSKTHTITLSGSSTVGGNNNSKIQLRSKGERVIEMEDIPGTDAGGGGVGVYWDDIVLSLIHI